ncbi:transcription factor, contains a PHD finger motif [Hypoxylon texense]
MLSRALPPISVGIDICRISRIYKNLTSPLATKFVTRILAPEELETPFTRGILKCVFTPSRSPPPQHFEDAMDLRKDPRMKKAAEFMAGRFAAKEAVIKAYSLRKLSFYDIVVTYQNHIPALLENETPSDASHEKQESPSQGQPKESAGPPVAIIKGNNTSENTYARLSISHDGDYATAVCLAMLEDPDVSD